MSKNTEALIRVREYDIKEIKKAMLKSAVISVVGAGMLAAGIYGDAQLDRITAEKNSELLNDLIENEEVQEYVSSFEDRLAELNLEYKQGDINYLDYVKSIEQVAEENDIIDWAKQKAKSKDNAEITEAVETNKDKYFKDKATATALTATGYPIGTVGTGLGVSTLLYEIMDYICNKGALKKLYRRKAYEDKKACEEDCRFDYDAGM